jgi:predicted AAA+ superfamily ATPase
MDSLFEKKIIDREAKYTFKRVQDSKLIKVVTGVRRCGKSFLISTMLNNRKFAYMNFDDDRLANLDTGKILPAFYEIYGKDTKIIFFDEIQNVDRWEMFVNRLHRTGFNVMITGSNAKMLSKELASHLTGRHVAIELFPFSFREYLDAISFNEDMQTTKGIGLLRNELKNYINNGGFPEIIMNKENPKIYLRELYRKIIERDIIQRFNISYKKTFRELAITLL